MSRTYTVVLCSALACMVAGEAPQIRTVDKSIELNVPDVSVGVLFLAIIAAMQNYVKRRICN